MSKINRRNFISAAGLSTYSLYVRADTPETTQTGEEIPICTQGNCDPVIDTSILEESGDSRFSGEPHMETVDLGADLLVAGGGLAGVCASLAAARNGITVILVQDRSVLGGNSSSEVRMHVVGANSHNSRPGWREGGIIEELRLEDAVHNPQRSFEMWSLLLYDKIKREPNIKLLLDTSVYAAETSDSKITRIMARCDKSEMLYRIRSSHFADCTGDARLALESGAPVMWGHEDKAAFGESLAWDEPSEQTQGSSILFTSRDWGKPMPYTPPSWARKIEKKQLVFRKPGSWEYGYWWIELGGKGNTIKYNEDLRFELLSVVTGVWDYIKNSGEYPESETWAINWIGMVPGKRESRRIIGEFILTQNDLEGGADKLQDAVCIGGWSMDDHPPGGFDDTDKYPATQTELKEVYNMPLRSLYSRDISNLFMAGRNTSCSHVAFSSTRVMATCAVMGQAVGTAAAQCVKQKIDPSDLANDPVSIDMLQQTLLKQDQTIKNLTNMDSGDLARKARITASGAFKGALAEHITNGSVRDIDGEGFNRWQAEMKNSPAWIRLEWDKPVTASEVRITFDTGFQRELTLSGSDGTTRRTIRKPQPETICDYRISVSGVDRKTVELGSIKGNYQRLRTHQFMPVDILSLTIHVEATNGSELASIYEVRIY
jgi:FAD dependent oxidoreductase